MPDLEVRRGSEADVESVVELLKASLGEGAIPRTVEFWNWKHRNSPFGPSPFWVAEAGSRIVGVRVFQRWTWVARSEPFQTVRAVDTATHPAFQGKGIFRTLTLHGVQELARDGVRFVFNTPNDKSRPGYLKMGWSTVGRTSLWIAPRSLSAAIRVGRSRLARHKAPGELDADDRTEMPSAHMLEDAEVRALLEASALSDGRYRTVVDSAYLEWRYLRCPGYRYGFTLGDSGRVLAVHRSRRRAGAKEVAICELIFDRERATAGEIGAVLRGVLRHSAADYGVAAPPYDARAALGLALSGFVPAPRLGPMLTVRPLTDVELRPNPLLRASWGMALGSLELF